MVNLWIYIRCLHTYTCKLFDAINRGAVYEVHINVPSTLSRQVCDSVLSPGVSIKPIKCGVKKQYNKKKINQ
jgi:hypothetical protein